jgi:hypothetical protein
MEQVKDGLLRWFGLRSVGLGGGVGGETMSSGMDTGGCWVKAWTLNNPATNVIATKRNVSVNVFMMLLSYS